MKKNFKLPVVVAVATALTVPAMAASFPDVAKGQWYTSAVESAVQNGLLSGYTDGSFKPSNSITRAEIASVLGKAFGATEHGSLQRFKDVKYDAWFYEAMSKAVNMGLFAGDNNNCLNPNAPITREEAAVVISKAFELTSTGKDVLAKFSDKDQVSGWATSFVSALVENGYMAGNDKGQLNPKGNITRAEFAQIMSNVTNDYVVVAGTVTETFDNNVVVRAADVVLKDTTVGGDVVVADGVGKGAITLDNVIINGDLIVRGSTVKLVNGAEVRGRVIVRNPNGSTTISSSADAIATVDAYTSVILDGKFETVNVNATANVEVKGEVETVNANAEGTNVFGKGKLANVYANANNVEVTVRKALVTAAENVTGVMAGDKKVDAGATEEVKLSAGGGGGGSSSSTQRTEELTCNVTLNNGLYSITGSGEFNGFDGTEYTITVDGAVKHTATVKTGADAVELAKTLLRKLDKDAVVNTIENKRGQVDADALVDEYWDLIIDALDLFVEDAENLGYLRQTKNEVSTDASVTEAYEHFKGLGGSIDGLIDEIDSASSAFSDLLGDIYGEQIVKDLLK